MSLKKSLSSAVKASKKANVVTKSNKAPAGKGIQSARSLHGKNANSFRLADNHNQTLL